MLRIGFALFRTPIGGYGITFLQVYRNFYQKRFNSTSVTHQAQMEKINENNGLNLKIIFMKKI